MRVPRVALSLSLSLVVISACAERAERTADDAASEPTYAFTTLEYPGASRTVASDIADDGRVVGWYVTSDTVRGFVHQDGAFTSVEYPGALLTHVTSIGADGTLTGAYRMPGEPRTAFHGFVRTPAGEFVQVRHPDHPHSMAQRILPNGTIVGCYHGDDLQTTMRAITVTDGRVLVREVPGSMHNGATPDGARIVGNLAVEGRAFVAEGDRITHLEAPGSTSTEAWDINSSGLIVGVWVDSTDQPRGYAYRDGRWTTLPVPNARASVAFGVNERGDIVGGWVDSLNARRAYVARRQ